jgi:hypothetical protein
MKIINRLCTAKQLHKTYEVDINLYPAPTGTAETTEQFAAMQDMKGLKSRHLPTSLYLKSCCLLEHISLAQNYIPLQTFVKRI